jgi:hypothetical protein
MAEIKDSSEKKTEAKEKAITLSSKITVEATETNPSVKSGRLKKGAKYEIHPVRLKYLVGKGYVKEIG